jgi:hypothetical protein
MKKDDVQLQRVYEKPLTVFKKPVRVKKLMLISLTGIFLGTLGYFEIQAIGWIIFATLNVILLIFSTLLYQKQILYFGETCIEASNSGDMFITKLHGHCSKCDGHLKIVKKRKGLTHFISYIQCDKDASHVWNLHKNHEK